MYAVPSMDPGGQGIEPVCQGHTDLDDCGEGKQTLFVYAHAL